MVFAYKGIDEFDVSFYVAHHRDLCGMSAEQAHLHYRDHGQGEGRPGLPGATRETLPLQRHSNDRLLEIGPFGNPFLVGPNVRYADCFSTEELRMRAQNIPGMQSASCPQIDYNLSRMSLHDVPDRFSAAFSSHCVEHQPDLIAHFNEVASVLEPGAPYFLVVPDKRYCFDHFRPLSTMIEVLAAAIDRRRVHTTETILENMLLSTHNDPARHWAGDHGKPACEMNDQAWLEAAASLRARGGAYEDAHAWRFVPLQFAELCEKLNKLGLIRLWPEAVFETPRHRMEFCAILRRPEESANQLS